MSADTVDDLHAAEDTLGLVTKALGDLLGSLGALGNEPPAEWHLPSPAAVSEALTAFYAGGNYCRPSCERDDNDEEWTCGDCCGCPGHAGDGHAGG